jgi:hypothetical protein
MKRKPPPIAIALAAILAFPLLAGETKEKAAAKPAATAAAPAVKAHVDPATGELVSPKGDPAAARGALAAMPAESAQPLKVEKVTAKAGGQKVNLQGRFLMESTASVGPDGKLSQSCNQNAGAALKPVEPAKEHRHDR